MKYRLLKDIKINEVLHPVGEIREFSIEDQMQGNKIMMCFGPGTFWPFEIGVDVEILPDIAPMGSAGKTPAPTVIPQENCTHEVLFRGVFVDEKNIITNYYYCPTCETVVIKALAVESFINPKNQERDRVLYEDAKVKHAQRLKNINPAL